MDQQRKSSIPRLAGFFLSLLAAWIAVPSYADVVNATGQTLQSSTRTNRVEFDYTYTLTVHNTGATVKNVIGKLTSSSPNTMVIDGSVAIANIGADTTTTSADTYTIRQNRSYTLNPADLHWSFTSTPLSPMSPTQQVAALEASGSIPKLERTASLAGTDANSNGIRDDVELFITASYTTEPQRNAAQQFASTIQEALLVDKSDLAAVKAVSIRSTRAVNCIYSKFDGAAGAKQPAAAVRELESVTTNTKTRLLEYLQYAKALNGTSGALPEGDTCE